ncbi:MAG: isoprenylcysteine carboxylmethyltransferase family protein [Gemmatimonadetes bacterium]|nr:isoprenylcysteine carboxylmethyltransferase family protein [Gemmatimonadota bacterium]
MSPPAAFLGALVAQQALHFLLPGPRIAPVPLQALGLAVAMGGALLHGRAARHFKRRGAPLATLEAPDGLVTDGPFRWSRNPMYLGAVLILAGIALLYGTLSPWLVPPAFAVVAARRFILPEERLLSERLGEPYRLYRSTVGRWLGRAR